MVCFLDNILPKVAILRGYVCCLILILAMYLFGLWIIWS